MEVQPNVIVDDKLSLIQEMIETGEYEIAVKESCTVFEIVFKKIFQQAIVSLPFQEREEVLDAERKIGKMKKGVEEFSFGELVGLFRESSLMDKWSKHTAKELGLIRTLDYSSIVSLRNRITHKGVSCSRGEANIVYEYLRNLLAVLGFADLEGSINQSFSKRKEHQQTEDEYAKNKKDMLNIYKPKITSLPSIKRTTSQPSIYSASNVIEKERLMLQARQSRNFDMEAINYVLDNISKKEKLCVLDLGCAAGFVANDRFGNIDCIEHVVGIDFNQEKIEEAKENNFGEKFSFYNINLESPTFVQEVNDILASLGRDKFDIIFSAFTILHLSNQHKALFNLRKLLPIGGFIILRTSDDGSKMAYPDEQNLVRNIVDLTYQIEGLEDRETGRKQYTQLVNLGFRDVKLMYNVRDTSRLSIEERYNIFQESFLWREDEFKNRYLKNKSNQQYKEEYYWIKNATEELEVLFYKDSFYYTETNYIAIGKK